MLSILFIFLYRITEEYGGYLHLPRLETETEFNDFIKQPKHSIIIFVNDTEDAYFSNYAIYRINKSAISFATASENLGKKYKCNNFPCSIPFKNGNQIVNGVQYPAPTQASLFYSWCIDILSFPLRKIQNLEQLTKLLSLSNITCAIGVGLSEIPSNLPDNLLYYSTSSELFKNANMNVSNGTYIFNGADRSLNLVLNDNFDEFLHSNIISYDYVDFSKKKYVAGFYFNHSNFNNNTSALLEEENKMKILKEVSRKDDLSKNFFFSPFDDKVIVENRLQFRETPLFVVLESVPSVNLTLRHWVINDKEKVYNVDYLVNFLNNIQNGKLEYHDLDNKGDKFPYPENDTYVISYSEFSEKVNQDIDVLAICYSTFDKYILIRTAVQTVVDHLNTSNITFVCLNLTCNEVPNEINVMPPGELFFFAKGQKATPIRYMFKRFQFFDILNFIKRHTSIKYDIPVFNNMEKEHEIALSRIALRNSTKI